MYQATPIAAAIVSYSANPTSRLKGLSSKNMSLHTVTYVTSIQSSIVNLTFLKCTGAPSSTTTTQHCGHLISKLLRQMFSHGSMMSYYCKSNSKHKILSIQFSLANTKSCRYANCSAWFISAYMQGLSGADATWANKKYHCHCTLPPGMAKVAKNHVHS